MNVIIHTTDGDYRMSVIYDKSTRVYMLIFSSTRNNHGQQYTCKSYSDAVNRFLANCRFYDVKQTPVIPSEATFLGYDEGQLWPKEKSYAKNRA